LLLSIERATTAPDGSGGQTVTWARLCGWWAKVGSASGVEQEARLGRLTTVETFSYEGRFDPRIAVTDRVNDGGRVLNIRSVTDPDGRRRRLTLVCEAGVTT